MATEGAPSPTLCPLGRFQPNVGAVECVSAPLGTFVDTLGAEAATSCPQGLTTLAEGATSAADCVEPQMLAVAYSNLDGVAGYEPAGTDVLIAKLIDANGDGGVSAGDQLVSGQYPVDFDATTFADFGVDELSVQSVLFLGPDMIEFAVSPSEKIRFRNVSDYEYFALYGQNYYADWEDSSNTAGLYNDFIWGRPGGPLNPSTEVGIFVREDDPVDHQFIDVDFFL